MAEISIAGVKLSVKDYYCAEAGDYFRPLPGEEYIEKPRPALWLYVNVTDRCNAKCPFCVSGAGADQKHTVDVQLFTKALGFVLPYIYGISFTGGEPLLYPELLDELIVRTSELVPKNMEIDLATNGTNLMRLSALRCIDRIFAVHISRHAVDQQTSESLLGRSCPSAKELRDFLSRLKDPGKVVLNCVVQKRGVECCDDVARYLDFAIEAGIQNSSFITMFKANQYCEEHYLSPLSFPFVSDAGYKDWNKKHPDAHFDVWNRHSDYEYCHCLSGSYENKQGKTRFYFRCPGAASGPDYCRQLVYTADNKLQDGFGAGRRLIWS